MQVIYFFNIYANIRLTILFITDISEEGKTLIG